MSDTNENVPLAKEKHIKYFKYHLEVLPAMLSVFDSTRMSIAFFAISGLDVLDAIDTLEESRKKSICDWIYQLQVLPSESGDCSRCGFQGSTTLNYPNADKFPCSYACGHLAMTYTGLACLIIVGDDLTRVNRKAVIAGVKALQQEDGSFCATKSGSENDMRFVYCAACICYMLNDWSGMDMKKTIDYIVKSMSYDCGFGQGPGLEPHGGITYCAVATLYLIGRLHSTFNKAQLAGLKRWSIMRQISGFQGRPNKPVDTCYSFWVGATLKLLDIYDMVNFAANRGFILRTQDSTVGGFSKDDETGTDPMHTYLGLSGLSLMGEGGLLSIHPGLNISERAVHHLKKIQDTWSDSV